MTGAALGWAMGQDVGWPLAKLLLIMLADQCGPEHWELECTVGAMADFACTPNLHEVIGAVRHLGANGFIHVTWYAPSQGKRDCAFGARTCDPECRQCREEEQEQIEAAKPKPWRVARQEWNRRRVQLSAIVYARDGLACRACGALTDLTVDHIVPLRRGGSNDLANLQPLCRPCNTKKATRL